MQIEKNKIGVIGFSPFGTAVVYLLKQHEQVNLYLRKEEAIYAQITTPIEGKKLKMKISKHENFQPSRTLEINSSQLLDSEMNNNVIKFNCKQFLERFRINPFSDYKFEENVRFFDDMEQFLVQCDALILCVSQIYLEGVLAQIKASNSLNKRVKLVVSGIKGIHETELDIMQYIKNYLQLKEIKTGVICGPNIAEEICNYKLCALTFFTEINMINFDVKQIIENAETDKAKNYIKTLSVIGGLKNISSFIFGIYESLKTEYNKKNNVHGFNYKYLLITEFISLTVDFISTVFNLERGFVASIFNLNCGVGDLLLSIERGRNFTHGKQIGECLISKFTISKSIINNQSTINNQCEFKSLQGMENVLNFKKFVESKKISLDGFYLFKWGIQMVDMFLGNEEFDEEKVFNADIFAPGC